MLMDIDPSIIDTITEILDDPNTVITTAQRADLECHRDCLLAEYNDLMGNSEDEDLDQDPDAEYNEFKANIACLPVLEVTEEEALAKQEQYQSAMDVFEYIRKAFFVLKGN